MSKVLPHIFTSTHNSTQQSRAKKASKMGSASFPFQSLSGGIVKSEDYTVEYGDARSMDHTRAKMGTTTDVDAMSADSEEWIMMNDTPRDLVGQRVKSGV
jgi:hypothetical protein